MILGTFVIIGLTGFFVEAVRIAVVGRPAFEKWSFVVWDREPDRLMVVGVAMLYRGFGPWTCRGSSRSWRSCR